MTTKIHDIHLRLTDREVDALQKRPYSLNSNPRHTALSALSIAVMPLRTEGDYDD